MKKTLVMLLMVATILLSGTLATAQDNKTPLVVKNSSGFCVKRANLLEVNKKWQLQFSLVNESQQTFPGVKVVLNAYNQKGRLRGGQIWNSVEDLPTGSKMVSAYDLPTELQRGSSYMLEFLLPDFQLNDGEGSGCEESCTTQAIRACGEGKVAGVSCTASSCTFTCKDDILD